MSKLFFDKYLEFGEVEIKLKTLNMEPDEKQEIYHLIDELVHHRVLTRVLNHLPREHHEEFLTKFHQAPYDEGLIQFIDDRVEESVEKHIKDEVGKIKEEILRDLQPSKKRVLK